MMMFIITFLSLLAVDAFVSSASSSVFSPSPVVGRRHIPPVLNAEHGEALHEIDMVEPVFSEVCEYSGITVARYMLENVRTNPGHPELVELASIMSAIDRACKTISMLVRESELSGLTGLHGGGGSINVQGEEQKKLDLITNTVLKNSLRFTGKMGVLASEEEDEPVLLDGDVPRAEKDVIISEEYGSKFVCVFDPLDGSSNVDANIATGTIFGIFAIPEECSLLGQEPEYEEPNWEMNGMYMTGGGVPTEKDTVVTDAQMRECGALQAGNKLVASGYCLYSSATTLVFSLGGKSCQGFTLDESVGEFVLTHPDMKIPARGKPIYSVNEANRWEWEAPIREYVTALQKGEGQTSTKYTHRYIGSMVGDVHRTLLYGGIFGYPADLTNKNGKLRLLYEAAPMAYLIEAAGGMALSDAQRVLDMVPGHTHQRVPCFFGSRDDVLEMRSYYSA